jgi:hypothetical protein
MKETINDRDPKFMSELWQTLLDLLGVAMLVSTAYHPQTDGQSERTNQTVKIALRFLTADHPKTEWTEFLPGLTMKLNNMVHESTGYSATEIMYGEKVSEGLDLLNAATSKERVRNRFEFRQEAIEALDFAAIRSKAYYDAHYKELYLQPGDKVFLRLFHGYKPAATGNKKLMKQRDGPVTILRRVSRLSYEIELPDRMKRIHPVISVAQLEPFPQGPDPYGRSLPDNQGPLLQEGQKKSDVFEIETIAGKKWVRRRGMWKAQYLVQ